MGRSNDDSNTQLLPPEVKELNGTQIRRWYDYLNKWTSARRKAPLKRRPPSVISVLVELELRISSRMPAGMLFIYRKFASARSVPSDMGRAIKDSLDHVGARLSPFQPYSVTAVTLLLDNGQGEIALNGKKQELETDAIKATAPEPAQHVGQP